MAWSPWQGAVFFYYSSRGMSPENVAKMMGHKCAPAEAPSADSVLEMLAKVPFFNMTTGAWNIKQANEIVVRGFEAAKVSKKEFLERMAFDEKDEKIFKNQAVERKRIRDNKRLMDSQLPEHSDKSFLNMGSMASSLSETSAPLMAPASSYGSGITPGYANPYAATGYGSVYATGALGGGSRSSAAYRDSITGDPSFGGASLSTGQLPSYLQPGFAGPSQSSTQTPTAGRKRQVAEKDKAQEEGGESQERMQRRRTDPATAEPKDIAKEPGKPIRRAAARAENRERKLIGREKVQAANVTSNEQKAEEARRKEVMRDEESKALVARNEQKAEEAREKKEEARKKQAEKRAKHEELRIQAEAKHDKILMDNEAKVAEARRRKESKAKAVEKELEKFRQENQDRYIMQAELAKVKREIKARIENRGDESSEEPQG